MLKQPAKRVATRPASGTSLPYPNAAEGDVIIVSWGGVFVESPPLTAAQINDPDNNPIEILINKSVIEEAGDTDDSGLAVTLRPRDKVFNYAEDWCTETRIRVSVGINLLLAPIVEQALNNILDLETLDDDDVIAQVVARSPDFKHDDKIELTMRGTTVDGDLIEAVAPLVTIDNLPHTYELIIQNSDARKLAKTQVTFSYRLIRAGNTEPLRSKGQFVFEDEWYFPDQSEVDNPNGFVITIDGKHIHTLKGGNVIASYTLLMDKDGEIIRRLSRPATSVNVGEPQFELVKPILLGEVNGGLEPDDLPRRRQQTDRTKTHRYTK